MEEIIRLTGKEAEEFRRYREEKERKAMREQNRDAYKQLVDETIREVFPTLQVVSTGWQNANRQSMSGLPMH